MNRAGIFDVPYPMIGRATASISNDWVATEKLHGANMVVATDGARVLSANARRGLPTMSHSLDGSSCVLGRGTLEQDVIFGPPDDR